MITAKREPSTLCLECEIRAGHGVTQYSSQQPGRSGWISVSARRVVMSSRPARLYSETLRQKGKKVKLAQLFASSSPNYQDLPCGQTITIPGIYIYTQTQKSKCQKVPAFPGSL